MTTDLTPTARRTSRLAFLGLSVVLVAAGCAAASTPSPAVSPASNGSAAPAMGASAVAPGVPTTIDSASSATSAASGGAAGSAGSAGAGAAALYPYPGFAGTPGLAPDHTIVVAGSGQAMMKTDLSDRAKAERSAIDAALADARAQATAVRERRGCHARRRPLGQRLDLGQLRHRDGRLERRASDSCRWPVDHASDARSSSANLARTLRVGDRRVSDRLTGAGSQ